ncbi:uncharacterized protein [Triticum aestivum]|uniref:uncharacterized protein n=1 Tax=Triticum aestivum TaxID=4565 RepID=UPI000843F82A|nr:uncharacterized protein LOC123075544 [Triticum aestivum]
MPASAAPEQLQCSQPPVAAVCAKGRHPRLLPQHAGQAPMASPELTSQPLFSFRFVGIRLDPNASAPFRPPRLAWVVGNLDDVIPLAGSNATAGRPLPRLQETPPHRHLPTRAAAANASLRRLQWCLLILHCFKEVCQIRARKTMAMNSD